MRGKLPWKGWWRLRFRVFIIANLGLSKMFSKGLAGGGSDVLLLQFNVLLMRYSGDTGLIS